MWSQELGCDVFKRNDKWVDKRMTRLSDVSVYEATSSDEDNNTGRQHLTFTHPSPATRDEE